MDLIDIGANLGHESFDHDLPAVLDRARATGVAQLVVTGASREGSPKALELARAHPGFLFATAGVHPHHATDYTAEADAEMRALAAQPEVVAVGECGLDYFRDLSPRHAQRRALNSRGIVSGVTVSGMSKASLVQSGAACLIVLAVYSCGGSDAPAGPGPIVQVQVIVSPANDTMATGDSRILSAIGRDASDSRNRSATWLACDALAPRSTTTNSSPPKRASDALAGMPSASNDATCLSARSPTG